MSTPIRLEAMLLTSLSAVGISFFTRAETTPNASFIAPFKVFVVLVAFVTTSTAPIVSLVAPLSLP